MATYVNKGPTVLTLANGKKVKPGERFKPADVEFDVLRRWVNAGSAGLVPIVSKKKDDEEDS